MSTELLPVLVALILAAIGIYLVHQARRSREYELRDQIRKCEIARVAAEQSLANTVYFYRQRMARLEDRLAAADSGQGSVGRSGDRKFRRAKSAFARRFHPDRMAEDGPERRARTEIFKQFRDQPEDIEARKQPPASPPTCPGPDRSPASAGGPRRARNAGSMPCAARRSSHPLRPRAGSPRRRRRP